MIIYVVILGIGAACVVNGIWLFLQGVLFSDIPESFWMWPVDPSSAFQELSGSATFITAFILGSVLGLFYLRYESLGGCILLHGFYNMLAVMFELPLVFYIIEIPALVVALYMLWKEVRKKILCK